MNHDWEGVDPRDFAMGPMSVWEWVGMAAISAITVAPFALLAWLAFALYA